MELSHTRVRSGIVLTAAGHFVHDGVPLEHPGIERAFHQGLERTVDGRYLVRLGSDWAFVTVEDAPYQVRRALPEGGGVRLLLDDGTEEALAPGALALSRQGVLYAWVKGDHRARFARQAQADLAPLLEEDAAGFALVLGGRRTPLGQDAGVPPPRPEDGPESP